jgi:hypothetical protein
MRLMIVKIRETRICHLLARVKSIRDRITNPNPCGLDILCGIPVPLFEGCMLNGDIRCYKHSECKDGEDQEEDCDDFNGKSEIGCGKERVLVGRRIDDLAIVMIRTIIFS